MKDLFPAGKLLKSLAIAILFAVLLIPAPAFSVARSDQNQDMVFLVDISSSMQNIFEDVKNAILDYAKQARPGDSMTVITFGEKVTLRIRQKISSPRDIGYIERELANLQPNEFSTYITGALDKGMDEIAKLEAKYPGHVRTIVLMSDGKNNPPQGVLGPKTFQEILDKYNLTSDDSGVSFFYLSLGEDPDEQVMAFIETVAGSSYDMGEEITEIVEEQKKLTFAHVFVEPVSVDLGSVLGPEASVSTSLAFFPDRGKPAGRYINCSISGRFKTNPTWQTIMEVNPRSISCSNTSWTEDLRFNIESVQQGTVVAVLKLEPEAGQVLFIDPPEIPVTVTIRHTHVKVLVEDELYFGPVDPRLPFDETQSILLSQDADSRDEPLLVEFGIAVPEGMHVESEIERGVDLTEVKINVWTDEKFAPDHSVTLEGEIRLKGKYKKVDFSKDTIDMRIQVMAPSAAAREMGEKIKAFLLVAGKWALYGVGALIALFMLKKLGEFLTRPRRKTALEGKWILVHLKGKDMSKMKQVTINLQRIGREVGGNKLIIGSSKEANITIPHKSVAAEHCDIRVKIDKGNKRIFIGPLAKNNVIVNLQKLTEPLSLSDRDLIEIGAYTFRFENAHPFKQIVVRYLDGRILKGTPTSWDIETDGFGLLPRDALPGSSEEIYVPFMDLKAVYFVRDFDGDIGKKLVAPEKQISGKHMNVTFHDGEVIEGYTAQTYNPSSSRFYFFPADQSGNAISMVVEREHLTKIEMLDTKSGKQAKKKRKGRR